MLFVADATLEKGTPAVVTSQNGLPKRPVVTSDQYDGLEKPWRPKTQKQILAAAPAPAPDMTSPLVLAAQPASAFEAVTPAAREARAEAPPKKVRVEVSAKKARAEAPPQNSVLRSLATTNKLLCTIDFLSGAIKAVRWCHTLN